MSVLWALVGYSLSFAEGTPSSAVSLRVPQRCRRDPNADYAATIPHRTYMIYQLMFAIITPALISGAFAERMKFSGMLLFMILWSLIVYFPMAHMVWGKGGFLNAALGGSIPTSISPAEPWCISPPAFRPWCARLYLGKRTGYPHESDAPAQPGAEHHRRVPAVGRLVRVQRRQRAGRQRPGDQRFHRHALRPAAAALGWMVVEWLQNGKPSMLGGISGAVAGLVAITPASGFVTPMPAMIIGLVAGVVCYFMVSAVKTKFGYDDALDAFGVHGIGGTLGAMLTGVFAIKEVNDIFARASLWVIDGNAAQVLNQLIGVAMAWVLAIVGTLGDPQDVRRRDRACV